MIGRFLEISVHAPDILASLGFYESLGFQQVQVNETWSHPYAVVSDGRLMLGLHGVPLKSTTLTFVKADLAQHMDQLRSLDLVLEQEHLGSDEFNEVTCHDPNGQRMRIVEARTFSPPDISPTYLSSCGYFVEYGIPVKEFLQGISFWERFGLIAMEKEEALFDRVALTSDHLNLGLHRSRALRHPVLVFEDEDMKSRLQSLNDRGFELGDEMPDALDEDSNAVLIAPEGTRLLLMQSIA
jgi:hypothetical protein